MESDTKQQHKSPWNSIGHIEYEYENFDFKNSKSWPGQQKI